MVQVHANPAKMRAFTRKARFAGKKVALVPTMGNLHAGHLDLVRAARQHADIIIVSIYVNPTQERDRALLEELQVDATFEPLTLYHPGNLGSAESAHLAGNSDEPIAESHETFVQVERLQQGLCGKSRRHFFKGVATVVTKLFNIVEPDIALFGKKDYQQWRLICRMVRDLDFGIQIIGIPTTREPDGLAMSSRNSMLAPDERDRAACIYQALMRAKEAVLAGQCTSSADLQSDVAAVIRSHGGQIDYVEVVDVAELTSVKDVSIQPIVIAVAANFGNVRLIDNMEIHAMDANGA